jgi:Dihydropteroate synthase and related enzymes
MGVINVTPDSFSDGGLHFHVEPAITEAWGMLEAGAAIIDVGGESTRPGSEGVSAEEELARIEPVIAGLTGAPVSSTRRRRRSRCARSSSGPNW